MAQNCRSVRPTVNREPGDVGIDSQSPGEVREPFTSVTTIYLEATTEARGPLVASSAAASTLIEAGASVKAVQRHLGHSSATTTLDVYSHLWPDNDALTRAALEAGLNRVSPACHEAAL